MWLRNNKIFNVNGNFFWNKSHAQVPVVDDLGNTLRIYYSTRDINGISRTSFIEVDSDYPKNIKYVHNDFILDLGDLGSFDESGIMPTCIINYNNKKYLYYIGWSTRSSVPYHNSIGLAESDDGIFFKKKFSGPIITTNKYEPFFSGTAYVLKENNFFRIYYLSCIGWQKFNKKVEPLYNIKYAESEDGVNWNQRGKVAIELKSNEGGLASASVMKTEKGYKMWYSYRGKADYRENKKNAYKIGSAFSEDGRHWNRLDNVSFSSPANNDENLMMAYPYVLKQKNNLIMFYNGNGFGKTGIFYATKKNLDETGH